MTKNNFSCHHNMFNSNTWSFYPHSKPELLYYYKHLNVEMLQRKVGIMVVVNEAQIRYVY